MAKAQIRGCALRILMSLAVFGLAACGGEGRPTPAATTYGLSGSVAHLDTGSVTISDGKESLTIAQGATSFAFATPLLNGAAYTVSVTTQPSGGDCVVNDAAGTVSGAAVTNIAIVCNTLVSQPLAIGVNAVGSLSSNNSRIFLPVTMVGANPVTINAVLDTGSAGTVLNASDVFPSSMVTTSGFIFPSGQSSITYNGVTITSLVATRTYGLQTTSPTTETGNLGFAQVTFGSGVQATTAVVPILFVYQENSNGNAVAPTNFANLIGVNPAFAGITVNGNTGSGALSPCTPQSTTTCGLASPFRYFTYASGVDKGFVLDRVMFAQCDITTAGSCSTSPALMLGLTTSVVAGFSTTTLSDCNPVTLIGTMSEQACSQVIPDVTVSSGDAAFTGPAIFDSGVPNTRLSIPSGMTFPTSLPMGSTVTIKTPSGFAYEYMTGTGYLATSIVPANSTDDYTNSGIGFFAQNSLLVDYSTTVEGWRSGP